MLINPSSGFSIPCQDLRDSITPQLNKHSLVSVAETHYGKQASFFETNALDNNAQKVAYKIRGFDTDRFIRLEDRAELSVRTFLGRRVAVHSSTKIGKPTTYILQDTGKVQ